MECPVKSPNECKSQWIICVILSKFLSLFPACDIYLPFVALSIFVVLSNFHHLLTLCYLLTFYVIYAPAIPRIINVIPAIVVVFFLGIYISLVISQGPSWCEIFSGESRLRTSWAVIIEAVRIWPSMSLMLMTQLALSCFNRYWIGRACL